MWNWVSLSPRLCDTQEKLSHTLYKGTDSIVIIYNLYESRGRLYITCRVTHSTNLKRNTRRWNKSTTIMWHLSFEISKCVSLTNHFWLTWRITLNVQLYESLASIINSELALNIVFSLSLLLIGAWIHSKKNSQMTCPENMGKNYHSHYFSVWYFYCWEITKKLTCSYSFNCCQFSFDTVNNTSSSDIIFVYLIFLLFIKPGFITT